MKALVVLGAAVWADGPSPTLRRRCAHAAEIWAAQAWAGVVVCGGLGRFAPTEAAAMTTLLVQAGVPPECIVKETASTNTLENLVNALPHLQEMGTREVVLVTDHYHGARARLVARRLGLKATSSAPAIKGAHLPTQARQYLREALALPAYALRLRRTDLPQFDPDRQPSTPPPKR